MLDGWYCRSIANMQAEEQQQNQQSHVTAQRRINDEDFSSESSHSEPEINYKAQYRMLKRKLKYLIYENECFQDALRTSQKKLLKVSRDRSFLLDRLLQYEKPENSTSESDETESSDDGDYGRLEQPKRKRQENSAHIQVPGSQSGTKTNTAPKRKRNTAPKAKTQQQHPQQQPPLPKSTNNTISLGMSAAIGDGHMTPEEVERHLQSRSSYLELLPERAPPTVPTEMFSNDPSLDSESNDIVENSPNVPDDWMEQ